MTINQAIETPVPIKTCSNSIGKIDFIQGLRGLAAIMVIFYHGSRFISPYGEGLGAKLFGAMGSLGVALFFVISGFIMVITTSKNDGTFKYFIKFITRRFIRVWPAYLIATIAIVYFVKYGDLFFSDSEAQKDFIYSILFLPYGTGPAPSFGMPVLNVGWTLNYEMYFYLFLGASLLFGKFRWHFFLFWLSFTLIMIPLMFSGWVGFLASTNYKFQNPYLNMMTSPIIWLFAVGVAMGLIYKTGFVIKNRCILIALCLLSVALLCAQYIYRLRIGHGVFEWGLTIVPMFFLLLMTSKMVDIKTPKPLLFLGNISFSLYLWHPLLQELMPKIISSYGFQSIPRASRF